MARAEAGAVVTVEVLVEEQQVVPVRVVLELLDAAEHGPATVLVLGERPGEPGRDLRRHVAEMQLVA